MDINSFCVEKIIQVLGKGKPKRHMKIINGQKPLANSTNSSHPKYASVITHNVRNHFLDMPFTDSTGIILQKSKLFSKEI